MATKKVEEKAEPEMVQAFVLMDCGFGAAGEVVTIPPADAETGRLNGQIDTHPDAIKAHS